MKINEFKWEIKEHPQFDYKRRVVINKETYDLDEEETAKIHCLLLILDAIKEK